MKTISVLKTVPMFEKKRSRGCQALRRDPVATDVRAARSGNLLDNRRKR